MQGEDQNLRGPALVWGFLGGVTCAEQLHRRTTQQHTGPSQTPTSWSACSPQDTAPPRHPAPGPILESHTPPDLHLTDHAPIRGVSGWWSNVSLLWGSSYENRSFCSPEDPDSRGEMKTRNPEDEEPHKNVPITARTLRVCSHFTLNQHTDWTRPSLIQTSERKLQKIWQNQEVLHQEQSGLKKKYKKSCGGSSAKQKNINKDF